MISNCMLVFFWVGAKSEYESFSCLVFVFETILKALQENMFTGSGWQKRNAAHVIRTCTFPVALPNTHKFGIWETRKSKLATGFFGKRMSSVLSPDSIKARSEFRQLCRVQKNKRNIWDEESENEWDNDVDASGQADTLIMYLRFDKFTVFFFLKRCSTAWFVWIKNKSSWVHGFQLPEQDLQVKA